MSPGRRGNTLDYNTLDYNTLDYMDQGSFLGLRALGHGPVIQFTWVYDRAVDPEGLRRFKANLAHGLLGRRVERSPLPFGRHRWVAWPGPADIDVAARPVPPDQITAWADAQSALPIDPEFGPSWRLAVQPLTDGGTAVTLVLSHTVADGVGAALSVAAAANGVARDLGYPPPGVRTRRRALWEDLRQFVRDVPDIARGIVAAARLARGDRKTAPSAARVPASGGPAAAGTVTVPSVTVHVPIEQWDRVAERLGGTSNSLLNGFAAKLGRNLGWSAQGAPARLALPVNERSEGDTRGNALTAVNMDVDDSVVTTDLSVVRAELKSHLSKLQSSAYELLGPLPLVPLVPRALARRLETVVAGGPVIGCSNIGELDPVSNRPDGTDAVSMSIRMDEHLSRAELRRCGGVFFPVVSGRVNGSLFMSVGITDADATMTRERLAEVVEQTLGEFGLPGRIR